MIKEFIPYSEALELKKLGFDEPSILKIISEDIFCNGYFLNEKFEYEYPKKEQEMFTWNNGIQQDNFLYEINIPTYSQAFRWFRERKNILATIYSNASGYLYEWSDSIGGTHRGWSEYEGPNNGGVWDTYEEAELACLKKIIEIAKNNLKLNNK